jgi:hypothetical protein
MPFPKRAIAAFLLCGCAGAGSSVVGDDGWSSGGARARPVAEPPDAAHPKPFPEDARKPWTGAAAMASLRQVGGRGPTEHLDGRVERTVVINEAALGYGAGGVADGAVIVQRHHPAGSDRVLSSFVMEKSAAGWRFLVLDAELRVAADSQVPGMIAACARCHADAPRDGLFGPPP